ncbi:flavin reductase [Ralstonia pseudosolanacearum]|uniref:flavin reductase family protein n=1 Tax=Ralstonia pseudosolanacearum TaxID=1310165 RepID=UPI000DAB690C|nr:flavin reductase family protein [Ralstonia pseudosolanacearum]AZU56861.1 flavin reductase [Ralstonia solanacearum]MCK4138749.1 flavin reductase family protein [Ralstonia pseudosolanacearum]QVX37649.1 flavin reductase family protein [Ralstonia solanacearum]RAA08609.1 flavin reductase [Ralstonia pseudosolanacearum]UQY81866.1 flavin reductase family protein [Ralstonia pseudosolanacearum]
MDAHDSDSPAREPSAHGRATPPDFDAAHFRRALSQFATGVTVVTTRSGGAPDQPPFVGVTASSFNSVSLEPPLVLWSLGTQANSFPLFHRGSHYVINVLSASQLDLCKRFATLKGDRFANVDYRLSPTGLPILAQSLAWFECHNRSRYDEGDHVIFVGEVERCGVLNARGAPLVFHRGAFSSLAPIGDQPG